MGEPTALYRIYDVRGELLYIGISKAALQRLAQHMRDKPWHSDIGRVDIEHLHSRAEALTAERDAIKAEKPVYNVVHNGGRDAPETREDPSVAEFDYIWRRALEQISAEDDRLVTWRDSVQRFLLQGLNLDQLEEAVAVTMTRPDLECRWRYFCGVAWNAVRARESQPKRVAVAPVAVRWKGPDPYRFVPPNARRRKNVLVHVPGDVV